MKVTIGVSNRHVHLTKDTYKKLFPNGTLICRNKLNQKGEFASTDTVDLKCGDKMILGVRVLGPFSEQNQIELLGSDLKYFGLNAPVRRSGVLNDTPGITLINENNFVTLSNGVIRAERHVHVPTSREDELGLHERDTVIIKTSTATFEANVKTSENGYFEVHIDKDEAEEYGVHNGDIADLII